MPSMVLYWDLGSSSWTTEANFTPNSNTGTLGGSWFGLPPFVRFTGQKDNFWWNTDTGDAKLNVSGGANIPTKQGDMTEDGSTKWSGELQYGVSGGLMLHTDPQCYLPYVFYAGGDHYFVPAIPFRVQGRRA